MKLKEMESKFDNKKMIESNCMHVRDNLVGEGAGQGLVQA